MSRKSAVPAPAPRIARFEKLAYGLFLHWGLYSLLGRGEWIQHLGPVPRRKYERLADRFTAAAFDPDAVARLAREAGMRYIVLTTRHHDGFSLYDTRGLSSFDAPHAAAGRDLVKEFVKACRRHRIVPFFYHTTLDWRWDSARCSESMFGEYLDYLHASVEVLCRNYGPIGGLWFDGNWSRPKSDWRVDRLYALIRRHQPEALIINNTGLEARGRISHPEVDAVTYEQGLPGPVDRRGLPKYIAGEMCQTLNAHWGMATSDFKYLSPANVIENLCLSRKVGANYLLNVGPDAEGRIPAFEEALLRKVGDWVNAHANVIYDGKPETARCEGRDFVLRVGRKRYLVVFDLGIAGHGDVTVAAAASSSRVIAGLKGVRTARWVDTGERLQVTPRKAGVEIDCTGFPYGTQLVCRVAELA